MLRTPTSALTGRSRPAARLGVLAAGLAACASGDRVAAPSATPRVAAAAAALPAVRFSEIHYDNAGVDAGERIEVSAPADSALTGWKIYLYNGNGGATYEPTRALDGLAATTCGERKVVVVEYPVNGIQNGDPDGFALVDPAGQVVEFLSYGRPGEEAIVAANGPAAGRTSTGIGVKESGSTPLGSSLARQADGSWSGPAANSFGACNDGTTNPPPGGPQVAVTVTPAAATVNVGATVTLTVAVTRDGAPVAPASVAWSAAPVGRVTLANQTASTVDVTGATAGGATITATATVDGQRYAGSAVVTVTQPATVLTVEGYSFRGSAPLPVGFQELYRDRDPATNQFIRTGITWATSDASIATVDTLGNVTARGAGSATITATETGSGRKGSIDVSTTVFTFSDTTGGVYADELQFGTPTDATPADDYVVNRATFAASWNRTRGQPNWVAYDLDPAHRTNAADRCDCFTPDPLLPNDFPLVTSADYDGSGYSRGHMTMSNDRTRGTLDNATTFYYSNIIPQTQQNNGGPWLGLEEYLGNLAVNGNKEIFIVAGGAVYSGTLNGAGRVAIPTHTWKLALILDRNTGIADVRSASDVEVIAVDMPNSFSVPQVKGDWTKYRVSVDSIEKLTGYDFYSALPDGLEALIEAQDTKGPRTVAMELQPERISLARSATVNVALLSGEDFDAAALTAADLRLVTANGTEVKPIARGTVVNSSVRDVNGDGRADRVIGFSTSALRAAGFGTAAPSLVLRPTGASSTWQAADATPPAVTP